MAASGGKFVENGGQGGDAHHLLHSQPFCKTRIGSFIPTRIGPTACAPPSLRCSFQAMLPEARSEKSSTVASPLILEKGVVCNKSLSHSLC